MPKRPSKHAARPAPRPHGRRLWPLLTLSLGLVLTLLATRTVLGLWRQLPATQYRSIRADALDRARTNPTGAARQGLVLLVNSNQFTAAWQGRRSIAATRDEIRSRLVDLRDTQVGRMQVAALTLLEMERRGDPVEKAWPQVQPYLTGAERAAFPHFLSEALVEEQRAYQRLGLTPSVAFGAAQAGLGAPHGPFLQYFVRRMTHLADAMDGVGDTAASQTCRRIVRRLLRQWVLESGPPSLRLPAAELLAAELDRSAPAADSIESAIAEKCRMWRREYRDRAAASPPPPPLLRISDDPPPPPHVGDLHGELAAVGWSVAATAVFMLVALVGSVVTRFAGLPPPYFFRANVVGLLGALIALGLAWPVSVGLRGLVREDLRRVGPPCIGTPRLPLMAGGVALAASAIAGVIAGRGMMQASRRWPATVGAVARIAWLIAALCVIGLSMITRHMQFLMERPYIQGPDAAAAWLADPNAHGLLADLRAWNP